MYAYLVRRSFERLFFAVVAMILLVVPGVVSADTATANQIIVHATIQPTLTVVVNNSGQITKLISNTASQKTQVLVYQNTISNNSRIDMTSETDAQVQSILHEHKLAPGIIYTRPVAYVTGAQQPLLSVVSTVEVGRILI